MEKLNRQCSKELLDIPMYPSLNTKFAVGDTVRAYRSGFTNDKPFKNSFIEGVVISTKPPILGEGYLLEFILIAP